MDRRQFTKRSLMFLGGGILAADPQSGTKLHIEYPQQDLPSVPIPPYRGQRYEDKVPDTLDVAEMSKLAIHAITAITDPDADYEIYWIANFYRNPPIMVHELPDRLNSRVEGMTEALPLLREVTGSDLNLHVDSAWVQVDLKSIGPDGLLYLPVKGIPWSRMNAPLDDPVWRADGNTTTLRDETVTAVTGPGTWGRSICAMVVYYLRDQNPLWRRTMERIIQRFSVLFIDQGKYGYVPLGLFEPEAMCAQWKPGATAQMPTGIIGALEGGNIRSIQGLAQYYRVTGYEPARRLAAKLVRYAMGPAQGYDAQGRFLFSPAEKALGNLTQRYLDLEGVKFGGHFHAHALGLLCLLDYALAEKDREVLEFVKSGYEWAKTQGSSLVGYFPEIIVPGGDFTCEGCELGDMIGLAVKLSAAGVGDYWDDVDRWVRNHFAEHQLVETDWIYRLSATMEKKPVEFNATADKVAERCVGSFASWSSGNEWATKLGIMQCCTGTCARTLYYIWEHMVERRGDELRVNLLLNRASSGVDVYSYVPYEGRVGLKIKQPFASVLVRAPQWVKTGSPELVCHSNGAPREAHWQGRFVGFGPGLPGDRMVMSFPIEERTVKETIGGIPYRLIIKGNTVVFIDPPGKIGPLYERAYYREKQVRWRNVQRFVPEDSILW